MSCFVSSIPYWILSVDLRPSIEKYFILFIVSCIAAHFFMLCTLFILKKTLWHKQTLVLFILYFIFLFFFSCFLSYLFVCFIFYNNKNKMRKRTNKGWKVQENSLQFLVTLKKIIMARFSYFIVKKDRRGQWLNNSFWSTCVLCSILVMSCLFHTKRMYFHNRQQSTG